MIKTAVLFDVMLYGVVMVNNIWKKTLPSSGGQIYMVKPM